MARVSFSAMSIYHIENSKTSGQYSPFSPKVSYVSSGQRKIPKKVEEKAWGKRGVLMSMPQAPLQILVLNATPFRNQCLSSK